MSLTQTIQESTMRQRTQPQLLWETLTNHWTQNSICHTRGMVPYPTMTTVVSTMSLILPTLLPLILMDHYIHHNRSLGDRLHILRAKIFLTQRLTCLMLDYPHTLHQDHTLIMSLPSSHRVYLVAITHTQLHTPRICLKNLALIMSLQKSMYVPTPSLILQRRVNQKVWICVCVWVCVCECVCVERVECLLYGVIIEYY